MTDDAEPTYSISLRMRRTTVEEAYVSVPVDERVLREAPDNPGTFSIDTDRLWAEGARRAAEADTWSAEAREITPHPVQQAPPNAG